MEARTIAIVGLNASGKTMLAERLRREYSSDSLRYISFCDTYGTATDRGYYLQQRWNQHDIDTETPTVETALERSFLLSGPDNKERRMLQEQLYESMGMGNLLKEYVISLSSGELRKMQLVKTLMANPSIIIIDNPFIGLDAEARKTVSSKLLKLKERGIKLFILVARENEIPQYVDEIIWTTPESRFRDLHKGKTGSNSVMKKVTAPDFAKEIVRLNQISIKYSGRTILDKLSWTVREGEHWALSGRNGSGKSTLLSLICADNPQGYACDISMFGHKRGTGESIWEIKRNIGYVSPEMHRSYQRNIPAVNVVASGLKDTIGLYVRPNTAERELCREWMKRFGIDNLAEKPFLHLSSGEQRMILVCRAFVKSPSLLVLDEPMHGLDVRNQKTVKDIIEDYCSDKQRTMIMVTHNEEELPPCIDHYLRL